MEDAGGSVLAAGLAKQLQGWLLLAACGVVNVLGMHDSGCKRCCCCCCMYVV